VLRSLGGFDLPKQDLGVSHRGGTHVLIGHRFEIVPDETS
jgi:hypothetical protein